MRKYSIIIIFFLTIFVLCKEQAHAKFISDEGTLVQRGVFLYYILDNKEYKVMGVKLSRQLLHNELLSLTAQIYKVLTCTFQGSSQVILTTQYRGKQLSLNIFITASEGNSEGVKLFDTKEELDYFKQVNQNIIDLSDSEHSEIMTRLLKL